jgi:hypothetical protein
MHPVARTVSALGLGPQEVTMTRHSPLRYALPVLVAAALTACASSPDVSETAAGAGVSSSDPGASDPGASDTGASGQGTDDQNSDAGNPGGPGDDGAEGGGGDSGGGGGGGNPGGPGDVLVFEESNVEYGDFRDTGSGHQVCQVEGKCTLADPDIIEGAADPDTGVDLCLISTFVYDPESRPNPDPEEPRDVFPEGATVTAKVKCPEPVQAGTSGSGESGAGESASEESGSSTTEESPADESPAADSGNQSQG